MNDCICNMVQNRRIVILLNVEPKGVVHQVLGNPVDISGGPDPAAAPTVKSGSQGGGRSAVMSPGSNPSMTLFNNPGQGGADYGQQHNGGMGGGQVGGQVKSENGLAGGGAGPGAGHYRGGGDFGGGGAGGAGIQGPGGRVGGTGSHNNFAGNSYNQGVNYNQGGGNYNQGGGNYNQGGGNYNQGGGGTYNYNQSGGGNINPGGGNSYNQGGSNFNDRYGGYQGGGNAGGYGSGAAGGRGGGGARGGYDNPGGRGRGGVVESNDQPGQVMRIMDLHPFINGFNIIARITSKGQVRTYKNQKGEGRVASIDLMDGSGDMRGTFFNDECDKWMSCLEVNQVYKITNGQLKAANRQYNQCKSDCEVTFGRDTQFTPVSDADAPKVQYQFVSIDRIEQTDPGTIVDILGLVQKADPVSHVTIKSGANAGNQLAKRDILLVDTSLRTIKLTLWDENIHLVNESDQNAPCIAIKNVRISDFGGRSLSTMRNSMIEMNPDIPEAHRLKGWYEAGGKQQAFSSLSGASSGKSSMKFMSDIKDEQLGHGEKPDYFTTRCWVTFYKHDGTFCYVANPENKRKVVQQGDNWFDESLNKVIDNPERRYVLSLSASDHTGSNWFSAFNDEGIKLLGQTADQLNEWKENGDPRFEETFHNQIFRPYMLKARAKVETWQDEARVKCTVVEVSPLDFRQGSAELLTLIQSYGVA